MFDSLEISLIEKKITEKLYELNSNRKLLKKSQDNLEKLHSELWELQSKVESSECTAFAAKNEAEAAIEAARTVTNLLSNEREIKSKQSVQLQTCMVEKDHLLKENRQLLLDNANLKRQLDHAQKQLQCLQSFQEMCLAKEKQKKVNLGILTQQVNQLEQDFLKSKEIMKQAALISESITSKFLRQQTFSTEIQSENNELKTENLSLKLQLEKYCNNSISEQAEKEFNFTEKDFNKWLQNHTELTARFKAKNEENKELQSILDATLKSFKELQTENKELQRQLQ